jgi:hypothetical protein
MHYSRKIYGKVDILIGFMRKADLVDTDIEISGEWECVPEKSQLMVTFV